MVSGRNITSSDGRKLYLGLVRSGERAREVIDFEQIPRRVAGNSHSCERFAAAGNRGLQVLVTAGQLSELV